MNCHTVMLFIGLVFFSSYYLCNLRS